MDVAISKTQKRAAKLLGIDLGNSYESAGLALQAAGVRRDAIPAGKTWRDAAKLNDAELLASIRESDEDRWNQNYRECVEY